MQDTATNIGKNVAMVCGSDSLCALLPVPAWPLQKDLLDACDIEVALVGHGMAQDQEQAELFEIEW